MQLAQLNIATAKAALDSDVMREFVDNLAPINALAEASPGFIWRLQDEQGDATQIKAFDDEHTIVNLSVWHSADTLKQFVFKSLHSEFLSRKKQWFHPITEASYVLWWVADNHQPTIQEAVARLMHLREFDETPHAFSFKRLFSDTADTAVETDTLSARQ